MGQVSLQQFCAHITGLLQESRHSEAVSRARHILRRYPRHLDASRLFARGLLESGQLDGSANVFRRVLGSDPENSHAWAGLGEVHHKQGHLDLAVSHLARAFELASDDRNLEQQLQRVVFERDGVRPPHIRLTRYGLARLHLRAGLLTRAIREFRVLRDVSPGRIDLLVALSEALWRNGQLSDSADVCQETVDERPYCLKANLILGQILADADQADAATYLRRAGEVDPENWLAQHLLGPDSVLQARAVLLEVAGTVGVTSRLAARRDQTTGDGRQSESGSGPPWGSVVPEQPWGGRRPAGPDEMASWRDGLWEEGQTQASLVSSEGAGEWLAELGLESYSEEEAMGLLGLEVDPGRSSDDPVISPATLASSPATGGALTTARDNREQV